MREVSDAMAAIWAIGDFTGPNRPIARATVQHTHIITKKIGLQRYTSYLFGNPRLQFELPNVKSVEIQRSIDMDAGTCTITLYNAKEKPIGQAPAEDDYVHAQPGWFTFNRGKATNPWGHLPNFWANRLVPDMLIRTWNGYGCDPTVDPHNDENQMSSGVWLIDTVRLATDKLIVIKCRDAARLLIDQIAFPPVIPTGVYPLQFEPFHTVPNPPQPVTVEGGGTSWLNPTYYDDSGEPYVGHNGSIGGHRPSDAFDGSNSTYWMSIGNGSPTASYAYEWIEGKIPTGTVAAVRVNVRGGPYRMYVSLHRDGGGWLGSARIPYDPNNPVSAPNGSDITYVKSVTVPADQDITVDVTDTANIDRVRVTFHDLWDSNYGTYQYRAEVQDFDVLVTTVTTRTEWVSTGTHWEGDYNDYSDIAKWLLAYAGFLWPADPFAAFQMKTDGIRVMHPPNPDIVLLHMRTYDLDDSVVAGTPLADYIAAGRPQIGDVWGDIEQSGTYGPSPLGTDIFDKKPLMDGLTYVRDILGFIFYVDEDGAAIFKSPNIWQLGNNIIHGNHRLTSSATREQVFVIIHEDRTLSQLNVTLDSKNTRERVVVASAGGDIGAVTKGFNPYDLRPTGMRRVAIWSDQGFKSATECQIMADLIAIRQLFTFRTDTVRIPGYPAIQVDDQIKLVEETTEENHDLHYVRAISSKLDHSTGEFWYDLDTHWLGTEPFGDWAFNPANLAPETQSYLQALGKIT